MSIRLWLAVLPDENLRGQSNPRTAGTEALELLTEATGLYGSCVVCLHHMV